MIGTSWTNIDRILQQRLLDLGAIAQRLDGETPLDQATKLLADRLKAMNENLAKGLKDSMWGDLTNEGQVPITCKGLQDVLDTSVTYGSATPTKYDWKRQYSSVTILGD